jgi:hypothetical protein
MIQLIGRFISGNRQAIPKTHAYKEGDDQRQAIAF